MGAAVNSNNLASAPILPEWALSPFLALFGIVWRELRVTIVIRCLALEDDQLSPTYRWQRFYEDAVLATDRSSLPALIRAAHAAIEARIEQLKKDQQVSAEERQAIADALVGLRVLRRETDA